tara:strand:+ start:1858 stop:3045 length:1188 start_codon:yes stop_codon:yes gene_type:complete
MSEENQTIEEVVETAAQAPVETPKETISYKEVKKDGTIKLDLGKLKEFQNKNTDQDVRKNEIISESDNNQESSGKEESINKEQNSQEEKVLEEVHDTGNASVTVQANEPVIEEKVETTLQRTLPENIENLVKFMEDTGGGIEEYVRLNADYSSVDDTALLKEYYKSTKGHLDNEEIDFLIEDNFSYDEDIDDDRDIRKKKLTLKEEVAKAKKFLNGMKDEYYKEVKLGSKLSSEQQEAINFYNKYNQEQSVTSEVQQKQYKQFEQSTNNVFNEEFKGFDFKVGDKKYRYNVKNAGDVKNYQSDISNFVKEFLDENDMMKDAKGYHKALYAGKNIDKIVSHFYEQGKADAIKQTAINSKNIDMSARTNKPVVEAGGMKFKVLGGEDSSRLKFKIRK